MAKSPKDLVRVRIGRSYGGVSNTSTSPGQQFRDLLDARVKEQTSETFITSRGEKLAKDIARRIDRELMQLGKLISKQMIGQMSRPGGVDRTIKAEDGEVLTSWKQLALTTVRRKRRVSGVSNAKAYGFFTETGALQAELTTTLPQAIRSLKKERSAKSKNTVTIDGVTLKLVPLGNIQQGGRQKRYQIASIDIELLPGVRTASLGSISGQSDVGRTMVLERRLGLSKETIEKLRGPVNARSGTPIPGYHRPLVQPALSYILRRRIPNAIDDAIKRVTTTVTINSRTNKGI